MNGKTIGRMKQTKVNGRVEWSGMTLALPDPTDHKYRPARHELAALLVELAQN